MAPRRRRPPKGPAREPPPSGLLDWTDAQHWDYRGPKPCRYCDGPTQLRDGKGKAAHKVCAEQALSARHAEAAQAYEAERLGE